VTALRLRSELAWLLESQVRIRIPLTTWIFFSYVVCCAVRGLCDELITRSEGTHRVCVCVCVCVCAIVCDWGNSKMKWPRPKLDSYITEEKLCSCCNIICNPYLTQSPRLWSCIVIRYSHKNNRPSVLISVFTNSYFWNALLHKNSDVNLLETN